MTINASTGQVPVRFKDNKGEEKVETNHLDLPPDLANGIILDVLKNISPETKETILSYVVATPKPRLVKLSISPQGEDTFSVAGVRQKAMRFAVKVELGGLSGLLAQILGKEPADTNVWIGRRESSGFRKIRRTLVSRRPYLEHSDDESRLGAVAAFWSLKLAATASFE
jgi:hypothetical protein